MSDDFTIPNNFILEDKNPTQFEREYLGTWDDSLDCAVPGTLCYYTHKLTGDKLFASIIYAEYQHGIGRAYCKYQDASGRIRNKWFRLNELYKF